MIAHDGVPGDDRGLLLGDGLFETLLAKDGALVDLAAHLDRLEAGCATLGLPPPDRAEAERLMRRAVADLAAPRMAVRLTLTAGSGGRGLDRPGAPVARLLATASVSMLAEGPARLALSGVRRNEGSPASRLKTLAYLDNVLARQEARARGADEAVMLNNRGEVASAAAANLFWLRDGRLFTPALACGVLAGVMRARVLSASAALGVEVEEVAASPEELSGAAAVFLTNSLIGVRPVSSLDGVAYAPSALVERLARLLA
ncbi:aminotransferase class IV [Phenylobacterium sp.]|uniref:aminotransferase class IV n=1 Tax=Phenylobacterium sp. TaxID=1871053 RepID=UPI00286D62B1|nr:aminotransferase class IV [Phenylobacterium sp.]